jgi:hypothetical protein
VKLLLLMLSLDQTRTKELQMPTQLVKFSTVMAHSWIYLKAEVFET